MNAIFRGSSSRWVNLLTTFAILTLAIIPPGSASVLCIAPGGHVEIEAVNAGCCSHPELESAQYQPEGSVLSGTCQSCVDLLVLLDGVNTLSGPTRITDGALTAPVMVGDFSAAVFAPNEISSSVSGAPVSALTSLRC